MTLAIWISEVGGFAGGGLRLSCNSFTLTEVEYLAGILTKKFNLDCTIQKLYIKNKYSIYIKKNSMIKLRNLILPHLHISMQYKLDLAKI